MAGFLFGGSSTDITDNLTAQIDGLADTFTTTGSFLPDSLKVYYNGVRQITGVTVTVVGSNQFRLSFVPGAGDYLLVDYNN